jgi:hypothetical protein
VERMAEVLGVVSSRTTICWHLKNEGLALYIFENISSNKTAESGDNLNKSEIN